MKIALIQPPIEDFYTTPVRNIPQGLLQIAPFFKDHETELLDFRHGKKKRIEPPEELSYLLTHYPENDYSPFSLYKGYYRFGRDETDIRDALGKGYDLICISSNFTTYSREVITIIKLIRKVSPASRILIGGIDATLHPEMYLKAGADFVIRGEGEVALPLLLRMISSYQPDFSKVPNLVRKSGKSIRESPIQQEADLSTLPFSDYGIKGLSQHFLKGKKHCMILASRGCPYHCRFCSIHALKNSRYRLRSFENVLDEMQEKIGMGFRSFDFEDDHFGGSKRWLNGLLDGIISRFSGLNISLQAMNGVTASILDDRILEKMRKAGFKELNLALVSPSETEQRKQGRPFGLTHFEKIVTSAWKKGFFVTGYLILGLPDQSLDEMISGISMLSSLPLLIGSSFYYLVPGSGHFADFLKKPGFSYSIYYGRSSSLSHLSPDCSDLQLATLFRICRMLNFIKRLLDYPISDLKTSIVKDTIHVDSRLSGDNIRKSLGKVLLSLINEKIQFKGTEKIAKHIFRYYPLPTDRDLLKKLLELNPIIRSPVFGKTSNLRDYV